MPIFHANISSLAPAATDRRRSAIRDKLNAEVSKSAIVKALTEYGMSISGPVFDKLLADEAKRRLEPVPGDGAVSLAMRWLLPRRRMLRKPALQPVVSSKNVIRLLEEH